MTSSPGGLRVSDADRDRAIAELSEHFQVGRLTAEELEDRAGRALQARTAGALAELFTDLPRRPAAVTGTGPAPARAGSFRPGTGPGRRCTSCSAAGSGMAPSGGS